MELKKHITDEKTETAIRSAETTFWTILNGGSLSEPWRNALIAKDKPTEDLDELLIRFCE